jgi:hypothetical protein
MDALGPEGAARARAVLGAALAAHQDPLVPIMIKKSGPQLERAPRNDPSAK